MLSTSNVVTINDEMIFHPGYYIKELLTTYTLDELSEKSDISKERLTDLIEAKVGINTKDACGLSKALGTSTTLWINLQKVYDQKMSETEIER